MKSPNQQIPLAWCFNLFPNLISNLSHSAPKQTPVPWSAVWHESFDSAVGDEAGEEAFGVNPFPNSIPKTP